MKISVKSTIFAAIAIITGAIVLVGYFLEIPGLAGARTILLRWAVILTAIALIVGIINLSRIHLKKITSRHTGYFYSFIVLIFLFLTIAIGLALGPTADWTMWIYTSIQVPIEASLLAILAVILVYAAARMLYRRVNLFTFIFLITALLVMVGTTSLPFLDLPVLNDLKSWVAQGLTEVWATAGARGILLGVALGTIATGLRILTGADRPYDGG